MSAFAFNRIMTGLKAAVAHAKGNSEGARVRRGSQDIDVGFIRGETGLTQEGFALVCGVSVGTLRNWEQRRRRPTGPARALLLLVQADPKHALRTMKRTQRAAA